MTNPKFWNRLLSSIEEGLVVPVLGAQMLSGENNMDALQVKVAKRVLESYGRDPDSELPLPLFRELNEAVSRLLQDDCNLQDLYTDIHDAITSLAKDQPIPEALTRLAAISHFKLFVTLTPDDLFARCLRKRCAVNEIVYAPKLPTSEGCDLPTDWLSRHGEVQLLYLFGKSRAAPMFAIHDEDILEYAHNIIARGSHAPLRFLGELQQRSLLLIGCNFPEWLSRFFLRLTNQSRLSDRQRRREWLIEELRPESGLVHFLKSYSRETEILSEMPPSAFVAELHERWQARNGGSDAFVAISSPIETVPRGTVFFISYCRSTDMSKALKLYDCLINQGVTQNEIWFDKSVIEPGQDFRQRILEGVRNCSYFLPLISHEADALHEKFFYREWTEAVERSKAIQGKTFIVPIILDEDYKPEAYARVPQAWKANLDFGHAPAGDPDDRTTARLVKLVRAERRLKLGA